MILTKEISGLHYHYTGHAQRRLYLGCEIEIDSHSPQVRGTTIGNACVHILTEGGMLGVKHVYDGSLRCGVEVITPPATLDVYKLMQPAFLKMFRTLQENNYTDLENKTGGHIHFSRRFLGKDTETRERNVDRLITWVYNNRDAFKKYAMRDTRWAVYNDKRSDDKYVAINTKHEHTIEFRMFAGVKMLPNLLANLELVEMIAMSVAPNSVKPIENYTLETLVESYKRTHQNAYNHWLSVK